MYKKLTLALLLLYFPKVFCGEMVHNFVNPDFGGSPFNGAHLLANATAQNNFQAQSSAGTTQKTPAQLFQATLNNQILSKLSQLILNQAFPGTGSNQSLPSGTSIMGDYTITNDVISKSITVSDTLTGTILVTLDLNNLTQ